MAYVYRLIRWDSFNGFDEQSMNLYSTPKKVIKKLEKLAKDTRMTIYLEPEDIDNHFDFIEAGDTNRPEVAKVYGKGSWHVERLNVN